MRAQLFQSNKMVGCRFARSVFFFFFFLDQVNRRFLVAWLVCYILEMFTASLLLESNLFSTFDLFFAMIVNVLNLTVLLIVL